MPTFIPHPYTTPCRKVARFCENYLRTIASKTTASLEETVSMQNEKFTAFEVAINRVIVLQGKEIW